MLLWETMRATGLGRGLSEGLAGWLAPRTVHDPGKIVADLAAALALGSDGLADIAVLREQPCLAGPVAPDPGMTPAAGPGLGFYAARLYSLMRPPRMGWRLIRS